MVEVEIKKMSINSNIPISYHHLNQSDDKPLLIFFHGYSDSARGFLRRAFPHLDPNYEILAINGLFPVPQKKNNEWKQAFAWYFADFSSNSILIHPEISAQAVEHLIAELGLQDRKKILLGFSQGGFFIPYVLPKLKNVVHLFGIGAAYRTDDYPENFSIILDAVHGVDDDVITCEVAEKSFNKLAQKKNPRGQFVRFPDLKHTMNQAAREWLKNRIHEVLK